MMIPTFDVSKFLLRLPSTRGGTIDSSTTAVLVIKRTVAEGITKYTQYVQCPETMIVEVVVFRALRAGRNRRKESQTEKIKGPERIIRILRNYCRVSRGICEVRKCTIR